MTQPTHRQSTTFEKLTVSEIQPFQIAIPQAELDDLQDRLARTRWTDAIPGSGWNEGISMSQMKEMAYYWREGFDWRKQEERLNRFPQFTTTIDGQNIHFIHVRSSEPNALPLILTHGWPSTFADFAGMIGYLTNPRQYGGDPADAFDVVIPSIPGFGFSGPTQAPGWNSAHIARAWDALMHHLGYTRYLAHGGDAGSFITREMGIAQPDGLLGIHILETFAFPTGQPGELDDLTDDEKQQMKFMEGFNKLSCHQHVQQTRPLTLAYGLTDSPVGQLAWICDPLMGLGRFAPPEPRNMDEVLTNVSIYWFTKTAGSSARWYLEDAQSSAGNPYVFNPTPTGVALFPYNLYSVRKVAERSNSIVHWSSFDRGGHFAAMEVPELLAGGLQKFGRLFR
ncbi:epoxide hydrolase family protein [Paenibacillus shenyangensis]|uniref:epoxide hydrolase family protein n=1 Tax=Paenibacillus sp. A9 TaxID=1284352 RepID=UPI00035EB960|nr:epoxide hydrolase family protein [Paenibacillus sp. A9]